MKNVFCTLGALALMTTAAQAGGIDRSNLGIAALFDSGRVLTFGVASVAPKLSGTFIHPLLGAIPTGDIAQDFTALSFSFKDDINDKLSYAIFLNQPYGADTFYSQGLYAGLEAHWASTQLAAVLKYKITDRASVYGGVKYVVSDARITVPVQLLSPPTTPIVVGPYEGRTSRDGKLGFVLGAAYEIPDIALRVGLTYESEIQHDFTTFETFGGLSGGATITGSTEVTLPQSLTLDFQTGIAQDTLLFGSAKWSDWSAWHVRPTYYDAVLNTEITGFNEDTLTWALGVGHRLNENLSVFGRITYEAGSSGAASSFSPTGDMKGIGVGATWTKDNMRVTSGVEYVQVGDTVDAAGTRFDGNSVLGIGIQTSFTF